MTGTKLLERYTAGERDFSRADLRRADLRGADLRGADLRGADLYRADLRRADLRGADLRGADLRGADLYWADLYGADLRRADLRGANFDFSVFPMWCGSFNIICDKRLVAQLLYHLSRLDVRDCPEWDELRHDPRLVALANQSHVITRHNLPELGV
jgi:hypothetical protein